MAKNDLSLNINTKYDGDGLKRLDTALKDTSKQAKNATDTISKISGAVSGIDGSVGKVAGNLNKVFSAFTQGGVVGLAIAGVTSIVGMCISKFKEMQEHAKAVGQAIKDNMLKAVESVLAKSGELMTAFNKQQTKEKQQANIANNARDVNNSIASNRIRQQHIQNRESLGDDEFAIERDSAKERLELAKQEAEAKNQTAQARVEAAQKELQGEQERLKLIEDERAELADKHHEIYSMESEYVSKMKELLSYRKWYEENGDAKGAADVDVRIAGLKKEFESSAKNIKGINEAVVAGLKKWQDQTDKIVAAEVNLEIETKKMEGAESVYQTSLMASEEAYKNQIKGIEKREKAEQERIQKEKDAEEARIKKEKETIEAEQKKIELAEERAKLEEERNKKIEESKEREEELDKRIKDLSEAIKKKEQEIAAFKLQNMNDGTRNLGDIRRERRKSEIQNQRAENKQDRVRKQAEENVRQKVQQMTDKDGNLRKGNAANMPWLERTVKEAIAAGVSNDRLSEILGSSFRGNLQRQRQELLDNATKNEMLDESKMSSQDQGKLKQLDELLDMTEAKQSNIAALQHSQQHAQEEKNELQRDMRDSLKEIKNKMDNLGL